MRAYVHLLVAASVLVLLGSAAVACSDGETAVVSPATQTSAAESVQADSAERADNDEDEHERDHEDEDDDGDHEDDDEEGQEPGVDAQEGAGADAAAFEVKRGCPACHRLVEADTGKYTLGYEAHERAEARGESHPKVARDGMPIGPTDDPNVSVCLTCHGAGSGEREGMGRSAPLSLRDIAHPSHLFSAVFVGEYRGNCMSCHNVSGEGVWQLLSEAVQVNEKGVPSPDLLPIPGLLDPSLGP